MSPGFHSGTFLRRIPLTSEIHPVSEICMMAFWLLTRDLFTVTCSYYNKQLVIVIWHKAASPQETDFSVVFARWCQHTLPSGHIGATWRIQLNLCFLQPISVHNPNGKSVGSAIFVQLMAERRQAHWHHLPNVIELVHIDATCRIRLNLCFLQPTRVHNPNGKSICSAVFAQLTAGSPYTLKWAAPSPKLLLPMGGSGIPSNTLSVGQPKSTTQAASQSVQLFLHTWPQSVRILYNGMFLPPSKLSIPMGRCVPPSNTWYLG